MYYRRMPATPGQNELEKVSRRTFLKHTTAAAAALAAGTALPALAMDTTRRERPSLGPFPWYRRTVRWGQTNITEIDPAHYDINWWRRYWRRTETQGVIVNAGGIVAYYPSQVPFHQPAQFLAGRDLFGELCRAAHEEGLVVLARMDSNRAHQELYQAHPDWFARDAEGKPQRAGELFVTCVNSPYYEEHLPAILREIIERYHPEGFTDNSWSGPGRSAPCFCENCQSRFQEQTGQAVPRKKNWGDPLYRRWIDWNYRRRLEIWDLNNRVTRNAGGPDCIWVGMNSGSISGQCQSFRDLKEICRRAEIVLLDHQSRNDASGFQNNSETGKLVHGLLGWDKLMPESMAMYQAGRATFRLASKPEAEARLWMIEGFAGGIQPWWHHVGAYHEDRRMYHTTEPLYRWHKANEEFLISRTPLATVGVVWSQRNTDFYGCDDPDLMVELPWRGLMKALVGARIPYLPVHADHLERDARQFSTLVLPNLAAMSDAQVASVRQFVARGGGLLATGETSLFSEWGDPRPDFALANLFGAHVAEGRHARSESDRRRWAAGTYHTYLRLNPELRGGVDGPHSGTEPPISGRRHVVLSGFEETDILPFGGMLEALQVDGNVQVPLTFVPQFPIYPPETAWMREPKTNIPGLILATAASAGRVAFLPADVDRRLGRDDLPDHARLLANLVRWTAKESLPLDIQGPGLLDCHLYQQAHRLILHVVNLTNPATWRQPVTDLVPVGPIKVRIRLPHDVRGSRLRLLVSGQKTSVSTTDGWSHFELKSVLDHEVVVLT